MVSDEEEKKINSVETGDRKMIYFKHEKTTKEDQSYALSLCARRSFCYTYIMGKFNIYNLFAILKKKPYDN